MDNLEDFESELLSTVPEKEVSADTQSGVVKDERYPNLNRAGRPPGKKNKMTQEIREAYVELLHRNSANLERWLQQVAAEDPEKAFNLVIRLSPFILPKLSDTEITIDTPINIILPQAKKKEE